MTAVILAGGRGSRMGDACRSLPKPMLPVGGKPILQRQIEALAKEGIADFIIVAGFLHEAITDYFGDGRRFGVTIRCYIEPRPMGTAGALKKLRLQEDFLLLNGDLLFDICLPPFAAFHTEKQAAITLYAHPNAHPNDSVLLERDDETGRVTACGRYGTDEDAYPNLCNAGIQIVSPAALEAAADREVLSFDADVLAPNIRTGRVYAYRGSECIFDVGTPERMQTAQALVREGAPARRRLDAPQKAVFLDRDGTVNEYRGYISRPQDMALLPGAAEAINTFHALGYLVIVATNQPVVARGACTLSGLRRIHNRMERLLGEQGAYLDDLFFCPHHPDAGFPGENRAYKIPCACRKPQPGLLLRAMERYHIDPAASFMVGDSETDVLTAHNAGCRAVYLQCGRQSDVTPEGAAVFPDLAAFAQWLGKQSIPRSAHPHRAVSP